MFFLSKPLGKLFPGEPLGSTMTNTDLPKMGCCFCFKRKKKLGWGGGKNTKMMKREVRGEGRVRAREREVLRGEGVDVRRKNRGKRGD